jgi:hypothetical protein
MATIGPDVPDTAALILPERRNRACGSDAGRGAGLPGAQMKTVERYVAYPET